jgi:hypothetical protein
MFWNAVAECTNGSRFSPVQKQIWELREKGLKTLAISRAVNVSQKDVKKETVNMRSILIATLWEKAQRLKIDSEHLDALLDAEAIEAAEMEYDI